MTRDDSRPFRLAIMTRADVQTAIDWAGQEGWNPGLGDADRFYEADPTGFIVGRLGDQPVTVISAVKYGQTFGFIGLYIADPAYRGRGLGYQTWQAAMASLAGRNVGLDGVLAQQDNYKKSGFQLAHRNIRYAGIARPSASLSPRVVDIQQLDFAAIAAYDRSCFPEARDAFLQTWLTPENGRSLALRHNGTLAGYGTVRPCRQGYKIGPLNADTPDLASELFHALSASLPEGSDLYLDLPEPNRHALALAEQAGMTPVFETARMYTGPVPPLALEKIYGITSFELG